MRIIKGLAVAAAALGMVAASTATAQMPGSTTYEVTITNVSRQILSPPLVYSHFRGFSIFTPGQPATASLAAEAEDADASGLISMLQGSSAVGDVAIAGAPLPPGQSVTLRVSSRGVFDSISTVAMLVTTNDGFMAATVPLRPLAQGDSPVNTGVLRASAIAWDAGSEANTEDCTDIPGPPCGSHGVRVTTGAEGFVAVHSGIHGVGDLSPAEFDWRNPVALVSVRRAR